MQEQLQRDSFLIEENHRNVHTFRSYFKNKDWKKSILFMADLHWDNPKSDHTLIKKHLEEAKRRNAKVVILGDLFCAMQGWGDPRGTKSDIRPEHNNINYLDSIINTAVDFFGPYADQIALITRGNHETSVQKRKETDMLQRFVDLVNLIHKPKQTIKLGGYGGWLRLMFNREKSNDRYSIKIKYFHGSGGGGVVTKGMIGNQRRQASIQNADIIISGHVHEEVTATFMYETLNQNCNIELKEVIHIITPTYKEEYSDGYSGWHIERGAPPKPLGGTWLDFNCDLGDIKFTNYRAK